MSERLPFRVPDQLYPMVDDHVLAVHERWQQYDLHDVRAMMPEPISVSRGERNARLVVLGPEDGEVDTTLTGVVRLPHQQAWKPSMFIRAEMDRQMSMPHSRMIVLPNNSVTDTYVDLSAEEMQSLHEHGLGVFYEHDVRVLEAYGLAGRVALRGDSFGGLAVWGLAAVGPRNFDIVSIHTDETPNADRTPKQLTADFLASGKWGWQLQAVADANIPSLTQALNRPRMAVDYARFGLAAATSPLNKGLMRGMASPHFAALVDKALHQYPYVAPRLSHAKVGYVQDSKMFDPRVVEGIQGLEVVTYTGDATYAHSTMDNPMVSALSKRSGAVGTQTN